MDGGFQMDNFVEDYKRIDKEVRERVSSDMIKVLGLDNMLYGTIHALVCKCIEDNVPRDKRREFIVNRVNTELNRWIE